MSDNVAVKLSDVITDLQLFASDIRAVDARARQLNVLVLNRVRDPNAAIRHDPVAIHKKFELPDGLPDLAQAANERIKVYQNVLENVSLYYGAITTCILPVLYALLGTCAYLLRSFEQQIGNRTFMPSEVNIARFLIAGIGGAVVGLFNNFNITQAASIPPIAIAFLVGYAVDVFLLSWRACCNFLRRTLEPAADVRSRKQSLKDLGCGVPVVAEYRRATSSRSAASCRRDQ